MVHARPIQNELSQKKKKKNRVIERRAQEQLARENRYLVEYVFVDKFTVGVAGLICHKARWIKTQC